MSIVRGCAFVDGKHAIVNDSSDPIISDRNIFQNTETCFTGTRDSGGVYSAHDSFHNVDGVLRVTDRPEAGQTEGRARGRIRSKIGAWTKAYEDRWHAAFGRKK
jgi:hypothetical protein